MPYSHRYGLEIPLPPGNRWVIGDIHGCLKTFKALLRKIQPKSEDQLFLLGDYINKGPASLEVLLEIQSIKGNIYPLLGNHDLLFLDYHLNPTDAKEKNLRSLNSGDLLDASPEVKEQIVRFLHQLPYYYFSGNFILVHAGFNFDRKDIFSDIDSMITIKGFKYDAKKAGGKTVVHGHYPTPRNQIINAVTGNQPALPLDNGCVYRGNMEGMGNLVGMELNRRMLIFQANLDQT